MAALLDGLSGRAVAVAEGATIAMSLRPPMVVGLGSTVAANDVATVTPPGLAFTIVQ